MNCPWWKSFQPWLVSHFKHAVAQRAALVAYETVLTAAEKHTPEATRDSWCTEGTGSHRHQVTKWPKLSRSGTKTQDHRNQVWFPNTRRTGVALHKMLHTLMMTPVIGKQLSKATRALEIAERAKRPEVWPCPTVLAQWFAAMAPRDLPAARVALERAGKQRPSEHGEKTYAMLNHVHPSGRTVGTWKTCSAAKEAYSRELEVPNIWRARSEQAADASWDLDVC